MTVDPMSCYICGRRPKWLLQHPDYTDLVALACGRHLGPVILELRKDGSAPPLVMLGVDWLKRHAS